MLGFREPGKARPVMQRMPDLSKLQGGSIKAVRRANASA